MLRTQSLTLLIAATLLALPACKYVGGNATNKTKPVVTGVDVSNNTVTIVGSNLGDVSSIAIAGNPTRFNLTTVTENQIRAEALSALVLTMETAYSLIVSNAYSDASVPVTFVFSPGAVTPSMMDRSYLESTGGALTGSLDLGTNTLTAGSITNGAFDFILGNANQSDRGSSGSSRALVKDNSATLKVNHQGDFTGGTVIEGLTSSPNLYVSAGIGGNVGIGTLTPNQRLEIRGVSPGIRLYDTTGATWWELMASTNTLFALKNTIGTNILQINTSGSSYLLPGGNVGIGTSSPTRSLDLVGDMYASTNIVAGGSMTVGSTLNIGGAFVGTGSLSVTGAMTGTGNLTAGGSIFSLGLNDPATGLCAGTCRAMIKELASSTSYPAIGSPTPNLTLNFNGEFPGGTAIHYTTLGSGGAGVALYVAGVATGLNQGFVGIGTTSPSSMLTVGTPGVPGNKGNLTVNGTSNTCILGDGAGATSCTSDCTLKTDVRPIDHALDKLQAVRGVYFKWIKDVESSKSHEAKQYIGVIAQEVEKVFPEMVTTNPADGKKMVDYATLIAPAIEAIKAQQVEINLMKRDLATLQKLVCADHPHHEGCP